MVNEASRRRLTALWDAATAAVAPASALAPHLPPAPSGRIVVVGAGKAAAPMAMAAAARYGAAAMGLVVTRHGHGLRAGESAGGIAVVEAGHPLPDAASLDAGARMLAMVRGLTERDLVLGLWSGGGSALLEHPLPGLTHADLRVVNAGLLSSGAPIGAINTVRKHLSALKGGRLAEAAHPAPVVSFAISDVPGDDPSTIASGPMAADASTQAEARAILERYRILVPRSVAHILADPAFETPKSGPWPVHIVARQADALAAAARAARAAGYRVLDRGAAIASGSREAAQFEARLALELAAAGEPLCILAGGELTVTGAGALPGGPNRDYALALAIALTGHPAIAALAADTDGIDGSEDAAGAFVFPDTLRRAAMLGLSAPALLAAHDSGRFFSALGDALVTGPTRTNVTDFRAILVGVLD
jgi:hydroxypyruvate reductase